MGGPISQGEYCSKTNTLRCPWHGYLFSTSTLNLLENPNEKIWIEPLAGEKRRQYRAPRYRLIPLKFEIQDGKVLIEHPAEEGEVVKTS